MTADDFGVGFEALLRVGSEVFVEVGVGVRSARSSYKQHNVSGKRKISNEVYGTRLKLTGLIKLRLDVLNVVGLDDSFVVGLKLGLSVMGARVVVL